MKFLLFIFFLALYQNIHSQNWELKKETENIKVYTADIKNSALKKYKIVAISNAPINKVYSLLTDYNNYTKMFKEISDFKLLSKNDTVCITYSLFEMPWPIKERDLITKITTHRAKDIIIVSSKAIHKHKAITLGKCIRISDFHETFILKKINKNQTECIITGYIDMGGTIPEWAQNMFITKSPPIKLIHLAEIKNKND